MWVLLRLPLLWVLLGLLGFELTLLGLLELLRLILSELLAPLLTAAELAGRRVLLLRLVFVPVLRRELLGHLL